MSTLNAIRKTIEAQDQAKAIKVAPNSADTSLMDYRESDVLISGSNATVKNTDIAGGVTLVGGEPNRANILGGSITLQGGHQTLSQSTSQAGDVNIFSGDGYLGGDVWIVGGDNLDSGASSVTGSITMQTGGQDALSTANTGAILVQTGATNGTGIGSGSLTLKTGIVVNDTVASEVTSGAVIIKSGDGDPSSNPAVNNGFSSSGAVNVETGFSKTRASGDLTLKSGNVESATGSGNVTLQSGTATNSLSGNVLIRSGSITGGTSTGDVTLAVGQTTQTSLEGDVGTVFIQGGNRPYGTSNNNRAGSVYIQGGKSGANGVLDSNFGGLGNYGGNIEMFAYGFGNIQADAYLIWFRTHGAGFAVDSGSYITLETEDNIAGASRNITLETGAHNNADNEDSGDITIRTGESGGKSTGANTKTSGDIIIKTGDSPANAEDTSTAKSGDITLETGSATGTEVGSGTVARGEVKVKSNSINATGYDNKLVQIASDGILKTLGINILGYGSLELRSVLKASIICRIPITFAPRDINNGNSDINVNPANIDAGGAYYPRILETYTGDSIWENETFKYANTKVMLFPRAGEGFRSTASATENMVSIQEQFYFVPNETQTLGAFQMNATIHGKMVFSSTNPNNLNPNEYQFFFDYVVYITD